MDYQHWLAMAASRFIDSESPKRDAEILLGFITGRSRSFILAFGETLLTAEQLALLTPLVHRRQQGEPIAYLIGQREFWSLPLTLSATTLIPRPDTECLVEQALSHLPRAACSILDLGSGSGAIALALASERPDCTVIGVDINADAVALACHNATKLALNNLSFIQGNWFAPLDQRFMLIVSNPPYIDANDPHLAKGDVRYEPPQALIAEANGMADLITIVQQAPYYIAASGWLLVEHGWKQAKQVQALFCKTGFNSVVTHKDYAGHDRITLGQWNLSQ
ncbi:peptide chain release factor N(5)-glutamine methyltransferase [Candidatus Fukatsuia symbiotica]|uniref:Release factor glutamine methyltransferase n=1 Tax=Candidatus Fukatsuia symbiotica TaxID=1878942 RepID=A0A2U8I872_9GAMM|nr:peptide chain release factor N(5)-glutamine methyltransferase [Candidatus Fukatsuia symbiotica]AWK15371.1 protein-(glutamine-N5) methyltransferase, release factor-specific [Candidatus Fukatsuia symbiotica]MEA9444656.1 peptide chain release factor N(5)-glutamine methyltransferase [Candidatus Fukatsuia symbiotica]